MWTCPKTIVSCKGYPISLDSVACQVCCWSWQKMLKSVQLFRLKLINICCTLTLSSHWFGCSSNVTYPHNLCGLWIGCNMSRTLILYLSGGKACSQEWTTKWHVLQDWLHVYNVDTVLGFNSLCNGEAFM